MATKDISDLQVLCAYQSAWERQLRGITPDMPYDVLMETTGQPFKVCYRAMERAADRDLIGYGVSLRTGWITSKGKELLGHRYVPLHPAHVPYEK